MHQVEQLDPVLGRERDAGKLSRRPALANAAATKGLHVVIHGQQIDEVLADALARDLHGADAGVDAFDVRGRPARRIHGLEDAHLGLVGHGALGGRFELLRHQALLVDVPPREGLDHQPPQGFVAGRADFVEAYRAQARVQGVQVTEGPGTHDRPQLLGEAFGFGRGAGSLAGARLPECLEHVGDDAVASPCRVGLAVWGGVVKGLLDPLEQVVEAGASFLVSAANFSEEGYKKFGGRIAMIPGCGTVTEILTQFSKGANFCKIFPARQLGGPVYVKAIDPAIHKTISLVPTGGTNADNIPDYIDAGVLVLGGSFSMIDKAAIKKVIEEQDYGLLAAELKKTKQLIDKARAEKWPDVDFATTAVEEISEITGRNFNLVKQR